VCLVGEPIEHGLAESGVGEDLGASHEKGGKDHALPCHHNLEQALAVYIDGAGLADDPKGRSFAQSAVAPASSPHFPAPGQCPCDDSAAGAGAEIETKIGNHSFRATGITAYLKNGGTLERAAAMANHASTRTPSSTTGGGTR